MPYDLIFKERVLQGNLAKDYDLILIPNQVRSAKRWSSTFPKADKPLAYKKTDKFKFLGDYGSSDDISGVWARPVWWRSRSSLKAADCW
jgi:hypothetical protein